MLETKKYGFIISLAFHLLIFAIPFSILVTNHFKEVELFVIDEIPKEQIEKTIPKLKTPPNKQLSQPQSQTQALFEPEQKIVEPAVTTTKQELPVLMPQTKPSIEPPKAVVSNPKPLLDVEFGSPNAPSFLHREMPVYPLIARRLGKEGRVLLRLTIDEKGKLLNVEVIEDPGYGFTDSALEAVRKSTFRPAMQDGKAVMSKALLPIRFNLKRD